MSRNFLKLYEKETENPCSWCIILRMFRWVCLLAISAAPAVAASACPAAPTGLDYYVGLGATGCTIGSFTVKSFSFFPAVGSVPEGSITVTPSSGPNFVALTFSSPLFSVSGAGSQSDFISYDWDPGDIRSLEDILNDPVVAPGTATVTTMACENNPAFIDGCHSPFVTVVVSDNGITLNSPNSISFPPGTQTLGILNNITLNANGASSNISGFENELLLSPEPATALPCLLLAAALVFRRLRLKRF